jgi:ribosomal-protein-alanine N-acetyltransferase
MTSMASDLILKGETIFLRPLTLADVNQNYLSWLQDEEVMQGIATSGYTIENLRTYVEIRVSDPTVAFFGIFDNKTNKHIGNVKLDFHDTEANVSELGLLIGDKDQWGKGVGSEACRLAIEYGFKSMKLRKIYLAVYESNPHAKKLYEKIGFITEGVLRKHVAVKGQYVDKYLMGLFKEEFK